jgi:hypothetical protein
MRTQLLSLAVLLCILVWGPGRAEAAEDVGSISVTVDLGDVATETTQQVNNKVMEAVYEEMRDLKDVTEQVRNNLRESRLMTIYEREELTSALTDSVNAGINQAVTTHNRSQGPRDKLSRADAEFYGKFYTSITSGNWGTQYSSEASRLSGNMEQKVRNSLTGLNASASDIDTSLRQAASLLTNARNSTTARSANRGPLVPEDISTYGWGQNPQGKSRNALLQAVNETLGFVGGEIVKTRALLLESELVKIEYEERRRAREDGMAAALALEIANWPAEPAVKLEYQW